MCPTATALLFLLLAQPAMPTAVEEKSYKEEFRSMADIHEQIRLWGRHVAWMKEVRAVSAYSTVWEGEIRRAELIRRVWMLIAEAWDGDEGRFMARENAEANIKLLIGDFAHKTRWKPPSLPSSIYPDRRWRVYDDNNGRKHAVRE